MTTRSVNDFAVAATFHDLAKFGQVAGTTKTITVNGTAVGVTTTRTAEGDVIVTTPTGTTTVHRINPRYAVFSTGTGEPWTIDLAANTVSNSQTKISFVNPGMGQYSFGEVAGVNPDTTAVFREVVRRGVVPGSFTVGTTPVRVEVSAPGQVKVIIPEAQVMTVSQGPAPYGGMGARTVWYRTVLPGGKVVYATTYNGGVLVDATGLGYARWWDAAGSAPRAVAVVGSEAGLLKQFGSIPTAAQRDLIMREWGVPTLDSVTLVDLNAGTYMTRPHRSSRRHGHRHHKH